MTSLSDTQSVQFLQWALPRLRLRWPGFRKVRRQVCRRIDRRLKALGLSTLQDYRAYLDSHPDEWFLLDEFCRISISRFYRDRAVFDWLGSVALPELAEAAVARGESEFRVWSAGCASGEEPYTIVILWTLRVGPRFSLLALRVLATDVDAMLLDRARTACYSPSSLKDLPPDCREAAFTPSPEGLRLREEFRRPVTFQEADVRRVQPDDRFDLILCRNLAFTYFEEHLQRETLERLRSRLVPRGILVIGRSERLPESARGWEPWGQGTGAYRTP